MGLLDRNSAILFEKELTYGTDPTPTGAANAMLVQNLQLSPLEGGTVTRDNYQGFLGGRPKIQVNAYVKIDFEVEIAGAGTAGSAAPYGPMLECCGLEETLTALTKAEYKPVSSSFDSGTIYAYKDGQLHEANGCRGTVSFDFTVGQIPKMKFSFIGIYVAPTASANPALTLTAFQIPKPVQKVNTTAYSLHGYSCIAKSLMVDLANDVKFRALIGQESVIIGDRDTQGKAVIQAPALGTKDFFAIALANTQGALTLTHGTTAGNIFEITSSTVQLSNPKYSVDEGEIMLEMDLSFVPSGTGNDEITITVK